VLGDLKSVFAKFIGQYERKFDCMAVPKDRRFAMALIQDACVSRWQEIGASGMAAFPRRAGLRGLQQRLLIGCQALREKSACAVTGDSEDKKNQDDGDGRRTKYFSADQGAVPAGKLKVSPRHVREQE
jgi:hypothetical protein